MRKAPKAVSLPLSVKLPPKGIREKFLIIYELEGCQKAANYLTKHYRTKQMKITLNGRKVPKHCLAYYFENKVFFTKKGLNKKILLHELYHHLIENEGLEMQLKTEEKEAEYFAREFAKSFF
jgi:hypothetical protein